MKVCTDSCLFGAWLSEKIKNLPVQPINTLDIGSGTGLLSLMLAQKVNTFIDAIEIEVEAAQQATENIKASPWKNSIQVQAVSLQNFSPGIKYDLIFSNPPFFYNELKSDNQQKNNAKHETTLTLDVMVQFIVQHLSPDGQAALLLPFHRMADFEKMAQEKGLFVTQRVLIKQTPGHQYFRSILLLSGIQKKNISEESICMYDDQKKYTEAFSSLLKDYYLLL